MCDSSLQWIYYSAGGAISQTLCSCDEAFRFSSVIQSLIDGFVILNRETQTESVYDLN